MDFFGFFTDAATLLSVGFGGPPVGNGPLANAINAIQSGPTVPAAAKPQQQELIELQEVTDEFPGKKATGEQSVSIAQAKECSGCDVGINQGISTSVVTLRRTRALDARSSEFICKPNETLDRTEPISAILKGLPAGNFEEFVCASPTDPTLKTFVRFGGTRDTNNYPEARKCDTGYVNSRETRISKDETEVLCTANDPNAARNKYLIRHINTPRNPTIRFASDKKLFIGLDKPFELTVNDKVVRVNQMAIYRPCPFRIENEQADAVLSLNDYSDATADVVVLIPISAGLIYDKAGDFVGRVMNNVNGLVINPVTGQYEPLSISVGHDWRLTDILESSQDTGGKNTVNKPFYKWQGDAEYEKYEKKRDKRNIYYGWKEVRKIGADTILIADPIRVSYLTSTYLQLLPYAPSSESAPVLPETYFHKNGKCTKCTLGTKTTAEQVEMLKQQTEQLIDPKVLAHLVGMFFLMIIAFVAIYYALDLALGGNGRFLMSGPVSIAGWLAGPATQQPPA